MKISRLDFLKVFEAVPAIGFFLFGVLGLCFSLLTHLNKLVGWDSPIDTEAWLQSSALPEGISLAEAEDRVYSTSEYYGVIIQQLSSQMKLLFTGTPITSAFEPETYVWQGIVSLTFYLVAGICLYLAVNVTLKNRTLAAGAWALFHTLPVFLGAAAVNYKDVPLASGLTITSSALAILWAQRGSPVRFKARWMPIVMGSVGGSLVLTSRPGSWPLLFGLIIGSASLFLFLDWKNRANSEKIAFIAALFAPIGIGLLALFLSNPFAKYGFLRWLLESYFVMSHYPGEGSALVAGQSTSWTDPPKWYVPAWIFAQTPEPTLLALFGSLVLMAIFLCRRASRKKMGALVGLSPFAIQGLLFPLLIILAGSSIYNGIRHLMFIWPAIPIVLISGVYLFEMRFRKKGGRNLFRTLTLFPVIVYSLAVTSVWLPYSYSRVNTIADVQREKPNWELDFWGLSAKEGVEKLRNLGYSSIAIVPDGHPYKSSLGVNSSIIAGSRSDGLVGVYQFFPHWNQPEDSCLEIFRIKRDGFTLGIGYECPGEIQVNGDQ